MGHAYARTASVALLERELATGPQRAALLLDKAKEAGIGRSTFINARRMLGIESRRRGSFADGAWYWYLPEHLA
jgi:hypothetical protein